MSAAMSCERLSEEVLSQLNAIIDPCSVSARAPAGLVDMGLVRQVTLQPLSHGGYRAVVRISVTHPFCVLAGVFLNEVNKRLRALPQIHEVDAGLDSSTVWKPALMTAEYRARLAVVRNSGASS